MQEQQFYGLYYIQDSNTTAALIGVFHKKDDLKTHANTLIFGCLQYNQATLFFTELKGFIENNTTFIEFLSSNVYEFNKRLHPIASLYL